MRKFLKWLSISTLVLTIIIAVIVTSYKIHERHQREKWKFDQWLDFFRTSEGSDRLEAKEKILLLAQTPEQIVTAYRRLKEWGDDGSALLPKIMDFKTLAEWREVLRFPEWNDDLYNHATERCKKIATSWNDFEQLASVPELKKYSLEKMLGLAGTFAEFEIVYNKIGRKDRGNLEEIRERAFDGLREKADTFELKKEFLRKYSLDQETSQEIRRQMIEMADRKEELQYVLTNLTPLSLAERDRTEIKLMKATDKESYYELSGAIDYFTKGSPRWLKTLSLMERLSLTGDLRAEEESNIQSLRRQATDYTRIYNENMR